MKNTIVKFLGVLAFAGSALVSQAVPFPVGSSISFTSSGGTVWTGGGGSGVGSYTSVTSFGSVEVNFRSGSAFTSFTSIGQSVTFATPLNFATPFANPPLWSVGGFTFTLSSWNAPIRNTGITPQTLVLSGSGLVVGNGFEGVGDWTWSGNADGSSTFNFSSATVIRAPDGGLTIALLGLSLLGLEGLRRRFRS